jgi:hypothetical protein
MTTYNITVTLDQLDHIEKITAHNEAEAHTLAHQIVDNFNNLGHDHSTGWTLKSVVAAVAPPL